eukprot:GHVU01034029.1.p1 GENE.GHVU01034029.1~~GHVU01034029.1.p1  ORF type:complete len:138 (-),score=9.67 GHVU01034029.1:835-1248(-)
MMRRRDRGRWEGDDDGEFHPTRLASSSVFAHICGSSISGLPSCLGGLKDRDRLDRLTGLGPCRGRGPARVCVSGCARLSPRAPLCVCRRPVVRSEAHPRVVEAPFDCCSGFGVSKLPPPILGCDTGETSTRLPRERS